MKWKEPPIIKIYEALGSVADGRVEVESHTAKVYSSSRNKFYDVTNDPAARAIMTNDNGSYWKGYLGYPAIAFLLKTGVLPYEGGYGDLLKGVPWKDLNQKFKNDFDKTLEHILSPLPLEDRIELGEYIASIANQIRDLDLNLLGQKVLPPAGY